MSNLDEKFERYGIKVPDIILPSAGISYEKWAIIACDQFTSQQDYWIEAARQTEGSPSTLNLIFPECYLNDPDSGKRIEKINNTMDLYLEDGTLALPQRGFILVNRSTPKMPDRWGLVAALDLECYDFSAGSKSLIRATEGTILDRIPPRVRIREKASLELPHIMVLIDDPGKSVIEPLTEQTASMEKVYDFDLMTGSGHVAGYRVNSEKHLSSIASAFETLGDTEVLRSRYNTDAPFLFAMGDGNHSLATAKTIWENYKKEHKDDPKLMEHPSRWALVEIVNIYSDGIAFEAIHRVIFNINAENFLSSMSENGKFKVETSPDLENALKKINSEKEKQLCVFCHKDGLGIIEAINPESSVTAGTIQKFIDNFLEKKPDSNVDYIHGTKITEELGSRPGNIGLFLPSISKDTFFKTVIEDGAFPRKTFSMGEASEKRFYIECRKIK